MKASDFNLQKDLTLDPDTGIARFHDLRLVVMSADALGHLRQSLIRTLGFEQARTFFLKLGYQNGYADCLQMKINYEFDSEMDHMASGPVIHSWEGIVHAAPTELRFDRAKGEFFMTGVWSNSYEADQHLSYNAVGTEPVCWSLMGYASGWSTAFFGSPVLAIEPVCKGKGDANCGWLLKPPAEWGPEAAPYLEALSPFWEGL